MEVELVLGLVGDRAPGLSLPLPAEVGQDDDRELEALGAVHGHEPDDVVGLLGDAGVDLVRLALGVLGEPAGEGPQAAAAGGGEGPRLVDDREQVRGGLGAVAAGQRDLDQPALGDDALHQLGQAELLARASAARAAARTPP